MSVGAFFVGFFVIASLPVAIDLAVELTHPIPEPVTSGLLICSGAIIGIIMTLISCALIE